MIEVGLPAAGRTNSLADVAGLRVGHHSVRGDGALTGVSVVLAPAGGMLASVDVRGGAPGTRETDLLNVAAPMDRVDALVLTGGSAFGLATADGVVKALADNNIGFSVGGEPEQVVPIVPAAVLFDLGRGGRFRATPTASDGECAVANASAAEAALVGCVGAGTGAVAGLLKGGVGTASTVLASGVTVAALVAVNAMGSVVDPQTGLLYAAHTLLPGDADVPAFGSAAQRAAVQQFSAPRSPGGRGDEIRNTTIGVVATDAALTKAQCHKLAGLAHNGLAQTIRPVHTIYDGDTIFGATTATREVDDPAVLHQILCAATDVTARAVLRAVLGATREQTPVASWPSYSELTTS